MLSSENLIKTLGTALEDAGYEIVIVNQKNINGIKHETESHNNSEKSTS